MKAPAARADLEVRLLHLPLLGAHNQPVQELVGVALEAGVELRAGVRGGGRSGLGARRRALRAAAAPAGPGAASWRPHQARQALLGRDPAPPGGWAWGRTSRRGAARSS